MIRVLKFLPILIFGFLQAQKEVISSVYFEFDKFNLDEKQGNAIIDFIKKTDSSRIENIEIFGYTDDIGKEDYNFKLSTKRADIIQQKLAISGIKTKIIITIEGKGKVLINDNTNANLPEIRSKNRRVDVVINLKSVPKTYAQLQENHVVGDKIYLQNVLFASGSSKLTDATQKELERIATLILKYKNLEFEIQGHVCCTPPNQTEAVDIDTKKRSLSKNRAEAVYIFFISKQISKDRMTFRGYGSTVPRGKGQEYDRRVELKITKI